MRAIGCVIAGLLAACCSSPQVHDDSVASRQQIFQTEEERAALLVGVLHEAGTEVCTATGDQRWINRHFEVGFVPLIVAEGHWLQFTEWRAQPMVAHGKVSTRGADAREHPPADQVPCPVMQMRSDWVYGPDGMQMRRGDGPGLAGFFVERLERFEGLRAHATADTLEVELENTLGRPLDGPVTLTVHYEGCYGKPGSESRTATQEHELAPQAVFRASFPQLVQRERVPGNPEGTSDHQAYSIEVTAAGEDVFFDLDVPLNTLNADVSCPN